jgi:hypothetical protein
MAKRGWRIVGVAVAAAAFALSPRVPGEVREPRLEWYTSPPLFYRRHTFRVQVLIPRDWKPRISSVGGTSTAPTSFDPPSIYFQPRVARSTLSQQLEGVSLAVSEALAQLSFQVGKLPDEVKEETTRVFSLPESFRRTSYWLEVRRNVGMPYQLVYTRTNGPEFNATQRQICDSFKVIREK